MTFHHKPVPVCALLAGFLCQLPVAAAPDKSAAAAEPANLVADQPVPAIVATADPAEEPLEVIQVLGRRPDGLTLSSEKILNVAGAGNDPLRALEALPGVILATPGTGGPVAKPAIRGSSPVDNEY